MTHTRGVHYRVSCTPFLVMRAHCSHERDAVLLFQPGRLTLADALPWSRTRGSHVMRAHCSHKRDAVPSFVQLFSDVSDALLSFVKHDPKLGDAPLKKRDAVLMPHGGRSQL